MKAIASLSIFLVLVACQGKRETPIDPRSVEYNDRAMEIMQRFIREGMPDTTGFAQAKTTADSARVMFKDIVDSCQALLDSAVMYSPEHYLYYCQKAMFYAYCADYEKSYVWTRKALEKKDLPEIRIYAGMFLHKMGKGKQSQKEYSEVIRQYEMRDTLSDADAYNYAFALSLAGEKEKARQIVERQVKYTLMKKQLSEKIEGGNETVDAMFP